MRHSFRLAPFCLMFALASACGDDSDAVEATATDTEGTGTDTTSGGQTLSTTVSASDPTVSDSTGDTSDTSDTSDSLDDDSTGDDSVDDSTGDDSTGTGEELCGNDQIDDGEDCDGRNLDGEDCEGLGFDGGTLSCDGCTFDTSACVYGGDCCEANGTPSCDDLTCQQIVCGTDSECCDTEWTQACADLAAASCPFCGGEGEGACCEVNDSQGCEDFTCQQIVCASNTECCTGTWSQACADAASESCVVCDDGGGEGSCCEAKATAGCGDITCQQIVCASDPFCCSSAWDQLCADAAGDSCVVCGGGGAGDCCEEDGNGSPGCEDATCQQIVCTSDPFCCDTLWDSICAEAAADDCAVCSGAGQGDCCDANGSVGCEDITCQQIVCADDPFCCNVTWDSICADAADDNCAVCGGGAGQGDCCIPNGSEGCQDLSCQQIVCASDPFCCSVTWDQICADAADTSCAICNPGQGDCCASNGSPGCENAACQDAVCAVDPFCCSTTWDAFCGVTAGELCGVCN
jgi:hypothetical protein